MSSGFIFGIVGVFFFVVGDPSMFLVTAALSNFEVERKALVAFYNSTNGPSWTLNDKWLTSPHTSDFQHCDWLGITCDVGKYVTRVHLNGNGLSGVLPEELGDLMHLEDILLSSNPLLSGTIPRGLGRCRRLKTLHLANNSLVGGLPAVLSNCTNMSSFDASNNKKLGGALPPEYSAWGDTITNFAVQGSAIGGTLPPEWGSAWRRIKIFHCESNRLTGSIPHSFGEFNQLMDFCARDNGLSGSLSSSFSAWRSLRTLDLSNNNISGTLPPEFKSWEWVNSIVIASNRLVGTIPDEFSAWFRISNFDLRGNQLNGTLPRAFSIWGSTYPPSFRGPTAFTVSQNQLSGSLPSQWGSSWAVIALFSVSHNSALSGTVPSSYGGWASLREFDVSSCGFSGTLPSAAMAEWSRLSTFRVDRNAFEGSLPSSFGAAWPSLQYFQVNNNRFVGGVPPAYSDWGSSVKHFDVSHNSLTQSLPREFSSWSNISYLDVSFNQITGSLPTEWSSWTKMRTFRCTDNQFGGSLPATFSAWGSSVTDVAFSWNRNLGGTLPPEWSVWSSLSALEFCGTSVSGSLPSAYSKWGTSVRRFSGCTNNVSGTLPPEWSEWSSIEYFFGQQSGGGGLDGVLPSSWSSWSFVREMKLSGNRLRGSLPDEWGKLFWTLQEFDVGSNMLVGTLPSSFAKEGDKPRISRDLAVFRVNDNNLNGSIPPDYVGLAWPMLRELDVARNSLAGNIPPGISNMTRLVRLDVSSNQLVGTVPDLSASRMLEKVYVHNNQLGGTLPIAFSGSALRVFSASDNLFDGVLSANFARWTSVEEFNVGGNRLSGSIPEIYGTAWGATLRHFNVSHNRISGVFPSSLLDSCTQLTFFGISFNQFDRGAASLRPSWPETLPHIRQLHLQACNFVGTLPEVWAHDKRWQHNITEIHLQENSLTGSLPSSWASFQSLTSLRLNSNRISGTLPPEWAELRSLITLHLHDNQLSGRIPSHFASGMNKLTYLTLAVNNLSGVFPAKAWCSGSLRLGMLIVQNNTHLGPFDFIADGSPPPSRCVLFPGVPVVLPSLPFSISLQAFSICHTKLCQAEPAVFGLRPNLFVPAVREGDYVCLRSLEALASPATELNIEGLLPVIKGVPPCKPAGSTTTHTASLPQNMTDPPLVESTAVSGAAMALTVPLMATVVSTAVIGDNSGGSAQLLLATLSSSCTCDGHALLPREAQLALSPFALVEGGSREENERGIILGNIGLLLSVLALQGAAVAAASRFGWLSGQPGGDRDEGNRPRVSRGRHRQKRSSWSLKELVQRLGDLCRTPQASRLRFPNISIQVSLMVAPGIAYAGVVLLSADRSDDALHASVVVGTIGIAVVLSTVAAIEWFVMRLLVSHPTDGLTFRLFRPAMPFSPPVPPRIAAFVLSRQGEWLPMERRDSFGKLAAPYQPRCARWCWAVGQIAVLAAAALAGVRTRSPSACNALQAVAAGLPLAAGLWYLLRRPHRAQLASVFVALTLLHTAFVSILSIFCRLGAVSKEDLLRCAAVGSYIAIVGRVYVVLLPLAERRIIAGRTFIVAQQPQGQQGRDKRRYPTSPRSSRHRSTPKLPPSSPERATTAPMLAPLIQAICTSQMELLWTTTPPPHATRVASDLL